jgi:hypothetical protein
MNTEYTLYVLLAGIAFATALLSVVSQWLKADEMTTAIETGLQVSFLRGAPGHVPGIGRMPPQWPLPSGGVAPRPAMPAAPEVYGPRDETEVEVETKATETKPDLQLIGDDETALSRLCLGWGGAGTLLGMMAGGATYGFVGALLGAVIISTASVGAVVIAVVLLDRAKVNAHRRAAQTAE